MTCLVVDDAEDVRRMFTRNLRRLGYDPHAVANGREALAYLKSGGKADLVLLDYSMPDMDGVETFKRIHESWSDLPVVMVTAFESTHLAVEFMHAGGDMFVVKPVNFDVLDMVIREVTEKARVKRKYLEAQRAREASEAYMRAIFDTSPNGIVAFDRVGTIREFNRAAEGMFGYRAAEVAGKNIAILTTAPAPHESAAAFETGGRPRIIGREQEAVGRRKKGAQFPLAVRISRMRLAGKPMLLGTYTDISARKRVDSLNTRLGRIIEESVNEIYLIDAKTLRFLQVNRGGRDNLGYSMQEMKELTPVDVNPAFTRRSYRKLIEPLRRGQRREVAFETVHRRKDGSTYDVEVRIQFMQMETPPVFLAVVQDITERRRAQRALAESEASLANAQRIAHLGNWDWDIMTNRLRWSDEVFRIFGHAPGEFAATYQGFLAAVHPDDRAAVETAVRRSLEERVPYAVDHRVLCPDGSQRIVHEQGEVTYGGEGTPVHMTGTVQDITDRKVTEQALTESEAKFRAVVEGEPFFGTYMLQDNGEGGSRLVYASPKLSEILGYSQGELEARRDIMDLVAIEDQAPARENLRQRFAGDAVAPASFRVLRKDGMAIPVQVHGALATFRGQPVVVGTVRSLTAEQEAEERARRAELARAVAEKAALAKSAFLANVSHELRTPLTAILGFAEQAETALASGNPEAAGGHLSRVVANSDRLADLINGLLDLSKVEAVRKDFRFERHDLVGLAGNAVNDLKPLADRRHLTMTVRSDLAAGHKVACDGTYVSLVVVNLLGNAIKFADPHSEIVIRLWSEVGAAYISVADRGIGIPEDELERIFEPFAQSSLTDPRTGGTGLGLALCKSVIDGHGGDIWATCSAENEVVFTFFLPQRPAGGRGEEGSPR